MDMNRRNFLKSSLVAAAAVSVPGVWLRAREASALEACESGVNFVIVQLKGGNDALNTVFPVSDGTGLNRTTYETVRPWLNIAASEAGPTQIGNDPLHNGALALHPHMTALKDLYDSGNLAVVLGAHYDKPNLSHDMSERIWYRADPQLSGPGSGWVGRAMDDLCVGQSQAVPAVDTMSELAPLFYGATNVLAFNSLSSLSFPTLSQLSSPDKADFKDHFLNLYSLASGESGFLAVLGNAGFAAVSKLADYRTANESYAVNLSNLLNGTNGGGPFGLAGTTQSYPLARQLRTILALMKGKQPGDVPLGCRIFRATHSGFDTHSNQGKHVPLGTKSLSQKVAENFPQEYHGRLLHRLDKALGAFWQDCIDHGLHRNTVIMVFSEFSRRIYENGVQTPESGTDHGTAGHMLVIGPTAAQSTGPASLAGGIYGAYPELDQPDANGNVRWQIDFRQVYAEILHRWLGLSQSTTNSIVGAGGFTPSPMGMLV